MMTSKTRLKTLVATRSGNKTLVTKLQICEFVLWSEIDKEVNTFFNSPVSVYKEDTEQMKLYGLAIAKFQLRPM